jgi:hypothetical protein
MIDAVAEAEQSFGSIPPGTYKITLISVDEEHPEQDEPNESWHLRFYDNENDIITTSSAIEDLPRSSKIFEDTVDQELFIPETVYDVKAYHDAFPDPTSANQIVPRCAKLRRLGDPVTISAMGAYSLKASMFEYSTRFLLALVLIGRKFV